MHATNFAESIDQADKLVIQIRKGEAWSSECRPVECTSTSTPDCQLDSTVIATTLPVEYELLEAHRECHLSLTHELHLQCGKQLPNAGTARRAVSTTQTPPHSKHLPRNMFEPCLPLICLPQILSGAAETRFASRSSETCRRRLEIIAIPSRLAEMPMSLER